MELKFRQAIFINGHFSHFHYWGFWDGAWLPPSLDYITPQEALLNSQQYIGIKDKNGNGTEIFEGDRVGLLSFPDKLRRSYSKVVMRNPKTLGWNISPKRKAHKGYLILGNIHENQKLLEVKGG